MSYPNLDLLKRAAAMLQPLLPEIVFVGGCATGLLITDPGAAAVRGTYDVDVITEIASYADYVVFSERLRELGFQEDSREGAPLCRWQYGDLVLDVMPLDAKILGFSNRWYADALRTSADVSLPGGLIIRAITAPYFLGTKFEAFRGRGLGDYFASHDLEDFVAVIDGVTRSSKRCKKLRRTSAPSSGTRFGRSSLRPASEIPYLGIFRLPVRARIGRLLETLNQLSRLAPRY
jgi:hypothetical protein